MKLSAIIPAINEEVAIPNCIRSAHQAGCDEVIVVDGGSQDRTRDIARELKCRLVETPAGRAGQQNAGAQIATGDILLFLHADSCLVPECGEQLRAAAQQHASLCGGFRQRIEARGWLYRGLEIGNAARARWLGVLLGDQGIFVDRDSFHRVGGFPKVPLLEEVLLMKRLRETLRPILLRGPLHTSARRWQRHGVVRQTLRNWSILIAHRVGASPERLAAYYRRHDR